MSASKKFMEWATAYYSPESMNTESRLLPRNNEANHLNIFYKLAQYCEIIFF